MQVGLLKRSSKLVVFYLAVDRGWGLNTLGYRQMEFVKGMVSELENNV